MGQLLLLKRTRRIGYVDGRSSSDFQNGKRPAFPKDEVLHIENLVVEDYRGVAKVKGLNLSVRKGEIVGIAGIDGNGQSELIEAITGLRKVKSGKISINSKDITGKKPREITESGLGHIPQDRHKHGLVLDFSVGYNAALQSYYHEPFSKKGIMNYKVVRKKPKKLLKLMMSGRKASMSQRERSPGVINRSSLSGEKWNGIRIFLIAALPTRGLDVGAIEFIHKRLIEQRDNGKAVLLFHLSSMKS